MGSFLTKLFAPRGLNRYEIVREVARGGMSVVYEAMDKIEESRVAVKLLKPESYEVARRLAESFGTEEGEVALSMRHPNVIHTLSYGKKGRQYFIAMEFVDGPNLAEVIVRNPQYLEGRRIDMIRQMAIGLTYIHAHGLVHRDFCPKNVLLHPNGQAKIIDFGLSIPKTRKSDWKWDRSGTPSYMAPEQVRGQSVDIRTDVYAFGVSMFEILTGKKPFRTGRTRYGKMQPHLNVAPQTPSDYDESIPPELDKIVLKALEKERYRRYQSMDELMVDLQKVVDTLPGGEL